MIRADRVAKAYANMKPEELAAIAFQFVATVNEREYELVEQSVPKYRYICRDLEYRRRFHNIFDMASLWTIERQRCVIALLRDFLKAQTIVRQLLGAKAGSDEYMAIDEELDRSVDQSRRREGHLAAIDGAMLAVCAELGIDPATVRAFGQCDPLPEGYEPDPETLAELTDLFRSIATGERPKHTPEE